MKGVIWNLVNKTKIYSKRAPLG